MTVTPELTALAVIVTATALMWVPYVLGRLVTSGLAAALDNPAPGHPTGARWADRARSAHLNAVENLAVFAPLVLMAAMAGVSTPMTVLAAQVYVVARLAHYVIYAAGIPVARTLTFLVGSGATLVIAAVLLGRLLS